MRGREFRGWDDAVDILERRSGPRDKDASGDVTVGKVVNDTTLELASAPVTITNHSSGQSGYLITVVLKSTDGSAQLDSTYVAVTALEPGQEPIQTAQFPKKAPSGAVAKVTEVQRTASG